MSVTDVIRAWKDAEYRASLSDAERAALPTHPVGPLDLSDADLDEVAGALGPRSLSTMCWGLPICKPSWSGGAGCTQAGCIVWG